MQGEKKYKVMGYPEQTDPHWKYTGRLIGDSDSLEDARKLKADAASAGWGTVLIVDGSLIVE